MAFDRAVTFRQLMRVNVNSHGDTVGEIVVAHTHVFALGVILLHALPNEISDLRRKQKSGRLVCVYFGPNLLVPTSFTDWRNAFTPDKDQKKKHTLYIPHQSYDHTFAFPLKKLGAFRCAAHNQHHN